MSLFNPSRLLAAVAAATLTIFSAGSAFADQVTPDGDTVATATTDLVATACTLPLTRSGLVEVKRTGGGNTNHYLPGETLSIAITDGSTQVTTTLVGDPVVVPEGFSANGAKQSFTFPISTTLSSGAATGSTTVSVKVTSNAYPAGDTGTFGVSWNCVSNTAPSIGVGGVSDGAAYEFGAVPTASCAWTDAQQGSGTVNPSMSAITGPRAAAGLGSQTATCSFTDNGGLTATAAATYTIRDTTPPAITEPTDVAADAVDADGAPVSFSAPSALDAVDGPRTVTCVPASGSTFALGATTVTCSATDVAGNSASKTFAVTVADHTAPVVTVPDSATIEATSSAGASHNYSASASDNVDGSVPVTCTPPSGSTFPLGTTTVTCSASDAAGNESSASFSITAQDKTAPTVTVPEDMTLEATGANGAKAPFDAASATDAVDGEVAVECSADSGDTFPLGSTTVTCTATDAAGNEGGGAFTVTVVDTTAPSLSLPTSPVVAEATSPSGAVVTYTATSADLVDGAVAPTCTPASGTEFALGNTTVTCTVTDAAGNSASGAFGVTVRDTTAPSIPDLGDVTAEATGADGAVVTYTTPMADDLVSGEVALVCVPVSGGTFALGNTTVTCTATDAAGNESSKAFTVGVVDTTAPEFADLQVATVEATGPNGAEVSYAPTATDAVDPDVAISCDPVSGTVFAIGSHQVTCTATDDSDNGSELEFTVNVADTTAPVVSTPPSQTIEATGPGGAAHSWVAPTATDIVDGDVPVTCDRAQGSTFPLGSTVVTCEATDANGNTGSSAFTVTVTDTTAPAITPHTNVAVAATSASGAVVSYTNPSASDLVDGAVATVCTPPSGTAFPLGTTTVTCTATDAAGNAATSTFTVTVALDWGGVLKPVEQGGVYKQGSTIPVKFVLTGASAGITNLPATLWVRRTGVAGGGAAQAVSTSNATTGNLFRYTDGQYLFNLNTKPLQVGTYELRIDLGDGVSHTVSITLR